MQAPRLFSLVATATLVAGTTLQNVNYGAFTETATYSIAQQLGFFTAYGLNVTFLQVPNSTHGYATLLNGGCDIMTGTIDNAVNLRFNSNETLTVTGQLDQGPELTIASIPNITEPAQLEGLPIMVDSPVSGYAYLVRKVLSAYGLLLEDGDYSFVAVGATVTRYADLVAGQLPNGTEEYATLLTYPFTSNSTVEPEDVRPNILAKVVDFVNPIVSSAFTVRDSALTNSTDRALIRTFMAAMYSANVYLNNAANVNCSISAIASQLDFGTTAATSAYTSATNLTTGEVSPGGNFTVNREGILNIIAVREEFGGFTVPSSFNFTEAIIPGKGKLIDYSVRDEALNATIAYTPSSC